MKKQRIALFHNHPECSIQCTNGIIRALALTYEVDCLKLKLIGI